MLAAGANRGLQPHEAAASLADKAYHAIRELIVSLELPPGAVIDERALIERLSIGRTPVREALRRLAQERLVEVYPRRGMFVTGVDVRELARISEVRAVLEPEAARLAAERATEAERAGLATLLDELEAQGLDERALIGLDERIHRAVYRCAHNDLLEATLDQYYVLSLRIWMMAIDRTRELERGRARAPRRCSRRFATATAPAPRPLMRAHVQNFEQAMRRVLLTV